MSQQEEVIEVTFYPQEWQTYWGEALAVQAQSLDPVTFEVPREDATDENGTLLPDDSRESDSLKTHENAPEVVRDWDGPFYFTVGN